MSANGDSLTVEALRRIVGHARSCDHNPGNADGEWTHLILREDYDFAMLVLSTEGKGDSHDDTRTAEQP
jgi:hypothetical protein